jgi:negative regulator of flagellin synthesis FlgM
VKIDNSFKAEAPNKVKEAKGGKSRTVTRPTHQSGIQDAVELTGDAAKLQELEARLAELEITDPKKVESIRQAIADGTFQVDEEAVADGLISEAVEHLSSMSKR